MARKYENVMVLNARATNIRNLWEPSREYLGKPTEKPNYLFGCIVKKTQAHWSQEPVLAGLTAAMMKVHAETMGQAVPYQAVNWPIKDGDIPEPGKTAAEWAKGHWMITGSSGDIIKVEIVQGDKLVPLPNRALVKPGDFCMFGGAVAQKQNDARGIKLYINAVTFTGAGEEIAVGNSVTGAELMAQAKAQGLNPVGFAPAAAGGFGAVPQGFPGAGAAPGFAPPQHQQMAPQPAPGAFPGAPQPGFAPQGAPGFTPPGTAMQQPGFAPLSGPAGFAQTPGTPATAFPSNGPAPGGWPQQ